MKTNTLPSILTGNRQDLLVSKDLSLLGPDEKNALIKVFDECIARGGKEGEEVEIFERQFADHFGVKHAIAINSCTAGLQIALMACGVKPGDDVLVPPYTFAASAHAIVHAGANPIFTDIEPDTLCISPDAARQMITKRTKAILVVHMGGKPANMDGLMKLCLEYNLYMIEDAAQAHGARYNGKLVGTFGDAGVFSFSPKLMTSFRGGIVITNNSEIAKMSALLRFHGLDKAKHRYRHHTGDNTSDHFLHQVAGYSMAMTPLEAAILMPQLVKLDEQVEKRYMNAMHLANALEKIGGLEPIIGKEGKSNFYMFEALYQKDQFCGLTKDQFIDALTYDGVPVSPSNLVKDPAYNNPSLQEYFQAKCPITEKVYENLIVFGHPLQSLVLQDSIEVIDEIIKRIKNIKDHAKDIKEFLGN